VTSRSTEVLAPAFVASTFMFHGWIGARVRLFRTCQPCSAVRFSSAYDTYQH
jgi:hypothetical protein